MMLHDIISFHQYLDGKLFPSIFCPPPPPPHLLLLLRSFKPRRGPATPFMLTTIDPTSNVVIFIVKD